MSLNSTPGHSSSSYDSFYDPAFTAEIMSKMRVPDKIMVVEGAERPEMYASRSDDVSLKMSVPERIIIAGDNKHIALKESLPELKFDTPLPYQVPDYVIAAPPDVLTVDDYPYPTATPVVKTNVKTVAKSSALDQSTNSMADFNDSTLISNCAPEEEVAILRRQMRHLSRRVLTIEQENQQRQQREIIMYTLGLAYFFFKGLFWLHRHF